MPPHEGVAEFSHEAFNCAAMNIRVGTIKVTQRFLYPARSGLTHEPRMQSWIQLLPRHCKTKLERHVEPGRWRMGAVDLDTRKIMDGVPAALD